MMPVGLRAPLQLDEGGHVAAGAVLGLERAVEAAHHHVADLVQERLVAGHLGRVAEVLGEDEVEVPVEGVAEDDPLGVAVAGAWPSARQTVPAARCSMGKATSSMTTVVPIRRAAPTAGKSPLRTSQSLSASARSAVKFTGAERRHARQARQRGLDGLPQELARRGGPRSPPAGRRPPARARPGRPACPGLSSTERSEARSMSSTAATDLPVAAAATARAACSMSGKRTSALALWACSSTVRKVTSEMKARVPSEPTSRWSRMSTGSSKSTKALRA